MAGTSTDAPPAPLVDGESSLDRLARLDLEGRRLKALALLEGDPDVRVLTRFRERPAYNAAPPGTVIHHGLFLDLETTGLDPAIAEVIELGAVPFTFSEEGTIFTVGPVFQGYEQPKEPIPAEITALTGITDEMVAGKIIESAMMDQITNKVELVIAHNADYDRKIAERRWVYRFEHLPWACSQKQVDWKARGSIGAKLGNILMCLRSMFYEAHRAADDCLAGIDVLNHERIVVPAGDLPEVRQTALGELLDTTRSGVFRVYAHNSPFEDKDLLKARGFFWTGEKPWKRDFTTREAADAEVDWLQDLRPALRPQIKRIQAKHRYSIREESFAIPVGGVQFR